MIGPSLSFTRRTALVMLGAGATSAAFAKTPENAMRLTVIGQALVRYDLRRRPWPDMARLSRRLKRSDAVFSNLEVAIRGPREGKPTRNLDTLHVSDPSVIDCLKDMGITALATSNNHAFDVGTGGILDAIDALEARQFPFAGTGRDLAAAAKAGVQATPAGPFAFVAFATGFVRDGGMATPSRAGVNEVRRNPDNTLVQEDVDRVLNAIAAAKASGATVLAYQHNHYWERPEIFRTPEWQRALARQCVDAGASIFVGHGPPLLHGVEMYAGAPLIYCLGSFIFQTKKEENAYGQANWESLIVECRFRGGKFQSASITPLVLSHLGENGFEDLETRGRPSFSRGARARETLARVADLSRTFGYQLQHNGRTAQIIA
jgi:poly-gamma-glutamate capsule biosynthesis protein CapA/YwtB (metallophosphatase superfamily)